MIRRKNAPSEAHARVQLRPAQPLAAAPSREMVICADDSLTHTRQASLPRHSGQTGKIRIRAGTGSTSLQLTPS